MTGAFSAWCVVATETAFEAREQPYAALTAPFVLAIHPAGRESAEQAAIRAQLMAEASEDKYAKVIERERSARAAAEPGSTAWRLSVEHEAAMRNKIAIAVREIAQPREGKS